MKTLGDHLKVLGLTPPSSTPEVIAQAASLRAAEPSPQRRVALQQAARNALVLLANSRCPDCRDGTITSPAPTPDRPRIRCPTCAGTRVLPR